MFVFEPDDSSDYSPHKHLLAPKSRPHIRLEESLEQQLHVYSLALLDAGKLVYVWNLTAHLLRWSENLRAAMPFSVDQRIETESHWLSLIHPDDQAKFSATRSHLNQHDGHIEMEYRLVPGNGKTYLVKQTGHAQHLDGGERIVIGLIELKMHDEIITAPVSAEMESAASTVEYDYPPAFLNRLKAVITHCKEHHHSSALFIVNINNLAMIINAYGHNSSETVMAQLMQVIKHMLSHEDSVERIHRDQLAVIVTRADKVDITTTAVRIQTAVQNYGAGSSVGSLHVTCTIGSVEIPESADTAIDAVDKAYIALSGAQGIAYRAFEDTEEDSQLGRQQMGLANYLRKSIQENRLRLAYQPIVDSVTGEVGHYEALLRLIGDDGKISSAGALIPVAEKMGLIDMIDHIVLDMVMKELEASPNIKLAFNVSNLTTDNPEWLAHCISYVNKRPDLASRMIIEITETAAQRDLRRTAYFVAALQAQGCQVALDDFGSGYTSFRQLKALSVDMVKIDGAFIRDLTDNSDNRFFVKTLLDFTKGFGLQSVAEFVEKGETAKMLMELGVDYMQGYYFGKPENYRSWLNKGEYTKG